MKSLSDKSCSNCFFLKSRVQFSHCNIQEFSKQTCTSCPQISTPRECIWMPWAGGWWPRRGGRRRRARWRTSSWRATSTSGTGTMRRLSTNCLEKNRKNFSNFVEVNLGTFTECIRDFDWTLVTKVVTEIDWNLKLNC